VDLALRSILRSAPLENFQCHMAPSLRMPRFGERGNSINTGSPYYCSRALQVPPAFTESCGCNYRTTDYRAANPEFDTTAYQDPDFGLGKC
jgi:hypothetical protein